MPLVSDLTLIDAVSMPRPRKQLVSLSDTPYYHVTSRCVRRAFLCGEDRFSGKSYEHRRDWIESRVRVLSSLFAIEICAYAVMSNHYHLVVKLVPDEVTEWKDNDVLDRWCSLFKGPVLVQQYRAGDNLGDAEVQTVKDCVAVYRRRLGNLSWFMKCLNEPIARKANREDDCTGHFWESRFSSQGLKSEAALLSCMAYVDLNPVRSKIAKTPETSEYTSIRSRLGHSTDLQGAINAMIRGSELQSFNHSIRPLLAFSNGDRGQDKAIPMRFDHYLELVDATGRIARHGKKGKINHAMTPILERLQLSETEWLAAATGFEDLFSRRQTIGDEVASFV